jgi:hypothetical protein
VKKRLISEKTMALVDYTAADKEKKSGRVL